MVRPVGVLLAAVLAGGCGATSGPAAAGAGVVTGRVVSAPSCPVERVGSPCPPRPVVGAEVRAVRDGHQVARVTTTAGGEFRLRLRPGDYLLVARNTGGYASTAQARVTVPAGGSVRVTLSVDSGIR